MIRFAAKILIVMAAAGYVIRQAEPQTAHGDNPQVMHASYMTGTDDAAPTDVARHLSSFTNARILVAQASSDLAGFCDRQALACEAGRELLFRAAAGIRDIAASIAGERMDERTEETYMPLQAYRGAYPVLPTAPPPRYTTF